MSGSIKGIRLHALRVQKLRDAAIDTSSIHRIHSGQVVLDLQGAIKELVENSLDAGATSVEVRIKDNGLESIEVVDNGSGVAPEDWASVALKHHTSKLPDLAALPHVTTFGFRGEALSALCALSESVTVTTATKETAPMGAVIKLDRDGKVLDDAGRVARSRGTTVSLNGLFRPLPVRRKEFERNIKRELGKALTLLTAYALVPASKSTDDGREGVRLRVEGMAATKGAKRATLLSTDGRGSLRASVSAVWGPKALDGILDINLTLDVEVDKLMARREGLDEHTQTVRVAGLISTAAWGQGRSSTDRQFFYINSRPCELPKITRAINEVYKSFNTHQYPVAILDFTVPPESVDINVSPDKRTIFLHSESHLLEALKGALAEFFQPSRSSYVLNGAMQTVGELKKHSTQPVNVKEAVQPPSDGTAAGEDDPQDVESRSSPDSDDDATSGMVLDETAEPTPPARLSRSQFAEPGGSESRPVPHDTLSGPSRPRRLVQQVLPTSQASWQTNGNSVSSTVLGSATEPTSKRAARKSLRERLAFYASQETPLQPEMEDQDELESESGAVTEEKKIGSSQSPESQRSKMVSQQTTPAEAFRLEDRGPGPSDIDMDDPPRRLAEPVFDEHAGPPSPSSSRESSPPREAVYMPDDSYRNEITSLDVPGSATVSFDLNRLRDRFSRRRPTYQNSRPHVYERLSEGALKSAAGLSEKDNAKAEEALNRVITKDDFARMEVIGQFNRGFIIARLRKPSHEPQAGSSPSRATLATDDLFIIDQHASDEKFNFETLQRTTIIKAQKLIRCVSGLCDHAS